jgi:malic enzyme
MEEQLRRDALEYHRVPTCGKISVTPTRSLVNQRDLALAYSPGVAYACLCRQGRYAWSYWVFRGKVRAGVPRASRVCVLAL